MGRTPDRRRAGWFALDRMARGRDSVALLVECVNELWRLHHGVPPIAIEPFDLAP
jgi:hypothetical protein